MKTMTDYQLDTLRRRFAERGYEPLNSRRKSLFQWFAYGVGIGGILAAILFL